MLKPWREIAVPHEDVLNGTFQQAEFAADLSRVHARNATDEYQDPVLFFQRTFITEGMRLLLDSVVKRLAGRGGDPVIQLQTAFGGGKTHTMLAVYHLARGEAPASDIQGIPPILDSAHVAEVPRAQVVVLDGHTLAPNMPQQRGRIIVHTLWGELAWQLDKEDAYARIKDADTSGTSPGKEVLTQLLAAYAPCVILMDELVAYIRQFEDGKTVSGGTYGSNLSFLQALTEALKAVPTAVLLASLPESDKEAGSQRGINALRTLEHYFARVQALWKPVAAEEAFEIVRRRLFASITDTQAVETVCRAYADFYVANSADVPHETQETQYVERLVHAYPIHPEVFDRLYEDWSTLDSFQRTRGVLKLMAKVIDRLWQPTADAFLKRRGDQPRHQQNRILFLAADYDSVGRLKDQVRSVLAWQSIVTDYRETKIVLDNLMARNAETALSQAQAAVQRMIRETYKWLLAPMQEARPGKGISEIQWEHFALTPNASNLTQEIVHVLKDNELLITDWAPIHLANVLKTWFWKPDVQDVSALEVWQKTCQYLYLPRLRDDAVFRAALAAGTGSRDFFGIAYAKEDTTYVGFSFGQAVSPVLDSTLLVIEPHTASAYAEAQRAAKAATTPTDPEPTVPPVSGSRTSGIAEPGMPAYHTAGPVATSTAKHQFYASIELDPIQAKKQFADLVDEVVLQFTSRSDVKVKIAIEIQAESETGFDDGLQRAVKENCNVLHFKNAEFEEGE